MPELLDIQRKFKIMKRGETAGVQIKNMLQLTHFTTPLLMPPTYQALTTANTTLALAGDSDLWSPTTSLPMVHVPQDAIYDVEGACFTGPVQIGWIKQLLGMPYQFVLHVDGKYKLHHGGWVLLTLGTHYLRWDNHHKTMSISFAPLMYLFCKQQETDGAAQMLMDAVQITSTKYFGSRLQPGATMSDHSDAFRKALGKSFPNGTFGQCWPHLKTKFTKGEYVSTTWAHFEDVSHHLDVIHLAGSTPMKELLIHEIGLVWDRWGTHMRTFWNSYCVDPWDCWSIGDFACMLCTPNQNVQESWHKHLKTKRIPALFRASTERVFKEGLPQLIELDGINSPTVLPFKVAVIPEGMMKKALWYVTNQETHILSKKVGGDILFFFLRQDNPAKIKKITKGLVEQYEAALWDGKKDSRIKSTDTLIDICMSFHVVCEPREEYGVPECEGNPCKYDCPTCKGFKHIGICSHVLAINHILQKFNVRYQMLPIGQRTEKKRMGGAGGKAVVKSIKNGKAPKRQKREGAWKRITQRDPDSSDEEAEKAIRLGEQGK